MELILTKNFNELNIEDMELVNGGSGATDVATGVIAVGGVFIAIASAPISVPLVIGCGLVAAGGGFMMGYGGAEVYYGQ